MNAVAKKINSPIVGFSVVTDEPEDAAVESATPAVEPLEAMHEGMKRPDVLMGSTYKIKTPMSDHALYVTINDTLLNEGTEHEQRVPFEVFINSKNLESFQWVVALTRLLSAIFRKGGDVTFLVEELKAVFDPQGGYFKPGGKYMPSLVAEIGDVIERHLAMIGVLTPDTLSEEQQALIAEKREQYEKSQAATSDTGADGNFPASATVCTKCNTKAVVMMDGCQTCLNCGSSKCS